MKAIYYPSLFKEVQESITVTGEESSHLIHSLRIKVGDEFKVLNGLGDYILANVQTLKKKSLEASVIEVVKKPRKLSFDVAVGMIKKSSWEKVLDTLTQLGANSIYPLRTEFCEKYHKNDEREKKILVSALKQSNNLYLPEITNLKKLKELDYSKYDNVIVCHLSPESIYNLKNPVEGHNLILFGPEGGFSEEDLLEIKSSVNHSVLTILKFKTPILRTNTAISYGIGSVYAQR